MAIVPLPSRAAAATAAENAYAVFDALNPGAPRHPATLAAAARRRGPGEILASWQAGWVDRLMLAPLERVFVSRDRPTVHPDVQERLARARASYGDPSLLRSPELFFRPPEMPAEIRVRPLGGRLDGGRKLKVTFRSPYETYDPAYRSDYTKFAANQICHVHLLRHDREVPCTILCIHGWCGGYLAVEEVLFAAPMFYAAGFDVALITLPFHGRRTPAQALMGGQLFPSRDLRRTNEAFGQAIADLRVLMGWIRADRGARHPIGVLGVSLGGYTGALLASLEATLSFVVPVVAPASFADVLWDHGRGRAGRREAEALGFTLQDFRALWSIHCPLAHRLELPTDRAFIIGGKGDHIVPRRHVTALWEHWGRPRLRWFPGGHVLQIGRRAYLAETLAWIRRL